MSAFVTLVVGLEINAYPGYNIVTTGHSLGGALASLAGITIQQAVSGR